MPVFFRLNLTVMMGVWNLRLREHERLYSSKGAHQAAVDEFAPGTVWPASHLIPNFDARGWMLFVTVRALYENCV